jgi:RimJ/RimL family protein N-acetyltransferase
MNPMTPMSVPHVLRTNRLFLRPWRADDATALHPVLAANQAHLGPWIPRRVAEPVPIPDLRQRLAGFGDDFAADREWRYGMFSADEASVLGEVGLFPRNADGRVPFSEADRAEIGYWLRSDRTGEGLATEGAQALLDLAATLPTLRVLEIRCDARNAQSAAVPQRLGFVLADTVADEGVVAGEPPVELQVWSNTLRGEPRREPRAPG